MDNPAVLLLSEVYGTLKGGISTIYRRLATVLREREPDIRISSAVLEATEDDEEDAKCDEVDLLLPKVDTGDERTDPSLHWLTFDHRVKYPHLPLNTRAIVGHTDGTSRAACGIKQSRCPEAKVVLFIDDIPEDTERYKGDEKAMEIGKKEDSILEDAEIADVVFSLGDKIFDHFESQFRAIPDENQPQHIKFLPRPSSIFEKANAKYKATETMVVLCIGRVAGVEKLKGLDLAVEALSIVAGKMRVKLRVRGVDKEDIQATKAILGHCKSANLQVNFLPCGTPKDICKDMLQAHLVLMPSRAEPFGLVGLEAIAAGVPVLVSDKSGLADLINKFAPHYHNCIVKTDISDNDESNVVHWAACIEKVLDHYKAEFETAANFKRELLASRYWEESEKRFINVCKGGVPSRARCEHNEDTSDSMGSSSDEESLNYSILMISERIFDEEVLQDPEKFESKLSVFKQHFDSVHPYFKQTLSCRAKLRVKRKVQHQVKRINKVLFSGKALKSMYDKMVECFAKFCAILKKIEDGCVLCTLEFEDNPDLKSFLRGYRDGKLSETLTQELITDEMKQEGGRDLFVHVTLLVARDTASSRDKDLEEKLTEAFKLLSIETTRDQFRDIALKLGFEEGDVADSVKPQFSSQLVYDTLNMWRMREGKAATVSALVQLLRQLGYEHLADRVLQMSPRKKPEHESEEKGAVGGQEYSQEVVELERSFRSMHMFYDPGIPIINKNLLHSRSIVVSGGFGTVEAAYHVGLKQDVAIKTLCHAEPGERSNRLMYEARTLKRAGKSDYVISLLGVCLEPHFAIVMPYMENGSLNSVLHRVDVPWTLRWRMAHEISLGMAFLHRQIPTILHCNLKAHNVLLGGDFHVKISGFGAAASMAQERLETGRSSPVYTITHAPPEVLENSNNQYFDPTTKVDVYSFGVVLWEIITSSSPYEGSETAASIIYGVVEKQLRPDMRRVPKDLPDVDTVSQLMQKCWSQHPDDRPSFDDCEEQLRDVNNRSSREDILDAITYVKMKTTFIAKRTITKYKEIPVEEFQSLKMPTASKVPHGIIEPRDLATVEAEASYAYDAYICYCIEDRDFVRQMEEKLENPPFGPEKKGLKLWYAERDALPGMPIHENVLEGIERSRHVVLVLTPETLTSRMCTFEMEYAASLPPEARQQKVIPVMYKPTDLPSWLKSMAILDYAKEEKVRVDWFWVKLAKAISTP